MNGNQLQRVYAGRGGGVGGGPALHAGKAQGRFPKVSFFIDIILRPHYGLVFESVSNIACCLFSWRYNPLWLYFHSPVAGFSLLVFEVS
jgi:hypothetical protein